MTHRLAALVIAAGLALTACGERADVASPGRTTPDDTATSTTAPGPSVPPDWYGDEKAQVVVPKPGTVKPRPIPWQRAKAGADGRSVRIFFTSGVEPCHVLDSVTVHYLAERIMVTLYEGSDKAAVNQACIGLAVFKAVDVRLDQPLGKRTFGDGAPK
jgi:hypothetical protein